MSEGLSSRFNILGQSPLDRLPQTDPTPVGRGSGPSRWVGSRFNVQTTTETGQFIVWNTFRGSMSVFRPEQRSEIKALLTRRPFEARDEGVIEYLHRRGFLVEDGTDEYQVFQHAFGFQHYRSDVLELTLLASEDCNFRCQYCYEDFARGTMQPRVREAIKKLVMKRLPRLRHLTVGWLGGEPLYGWTAIEDLAPFFQEVARENSLGFKSHMTTNGYLLTPEVAEQLLSWQVRHFQITIDGTPEDHDKKRPGRDGSGTFWTIFNNLRELKRRSDEYVVDIRVNFDRENQAGLPEFLATLGATFGGDDRFKLRLRSVGRWGGKNDAGLEVCGVDESMHITNTLVEEARQQGLGSCDDLSRVNRLGTQVCYAARPYHFVIGAHGAVMKCTVELDKEERNIVGRLGDSGEFELNESKAVLWSRPAFSSDTGCQKCVVLPLCQGMSCPLVRIRRGQAPCPPMKINLKQELVAAQRAREGKTRKAFVKPLDLLDKNLGANQGAF